VLTVYGGKITTARKLAEAALDRIRHFFNLRPHWTAGVTLPGGNFRAEEFDQHVLRARNRWEFLEPEDARRLFQAYGTRLENIIGEAKSYEALGPRFAGGLTGAEVQYLMQHEWAETVEDVLWRRSKSGLLAGTDDVASLTKFMKDAASAR
jgi:glycerol-3-phosphate dehydrogenase